MKKILIIIDMQNDFISGALGTPEAMSVVGKVCDKIKENQWDGIYITRDTHRENYLETSEGRKLPVKHCIFNTDGWRLNRDVQKTLDESYESECVGITKNTFGSVGLADLIEEDMRYVFKSFNEEDVEATVVGVCTNICVISNVMLLKSYFPEMKIVVDAECCAGTTPERHNMALEMMKDCHIDVINYK